jgi:plasmid stabilization system protein ParE
MITYDFHPEVRRDLDEIWDFIAADNPEAADRLVAEIVDAIDPLLVGMHGQHFGHRKVVRHSASFL